MTGALKYHTLPEALIARVQNLWGFVRQFKPFSGQTLEQFELGFMRDTNPEGEVLFWERIADHHRKFIAANSADTQKVFDEILFLSAGMQPKSKLGNELLKFVGSDFSKPLVVVNDAGEVQSVMSFEEEKKNPPPETN